LRRPSLADTYTDLFGGTEFIAPDVLLKTSKDETTENRGHPVRCSSGGLAKGLPSKLILK